MTLRWTRLLADRSPWFRCDVMTDLATTGLLVVKGLTLTEAMLVGW